MVGDSSSVVLWLSASGGAAAIGLVQKCGLLVCCGDDSVAATRRGLFMCSLLLFAVSVSVIMSTNLRVSFMRIEGPNDANVFSRAHSCMWCH